MQKKYQEQMQSGSLKRNILEKNSNKDDNMEVVVETGKLKSPARQQSQRRGFVHETFRIRKTEQFQFKTD